MKQITILILSIVLFSCSKEMPIDTTPTANTTPRVSAERILINPAANIDSVQTKAVYAGSNMSLQFNVFLSNVVTGNVIDVRLFRVNTGEIFKVTTVKNGSNLLYDNTIHVYPPASQNIFYYVSLTLSSGEVLKSDQFQVH